MKVTARLLIVLWISSSAVLGQASSRPTCCPTSLEPENHAVVVDRLVRYHDSGEYDREIRDVVDDARDYLEARTKRASKDEKLAAVFDIDETSLSNWDVLSGCGFCSYPSQLKLYPNAQDAAIVPVLELFNYAKKNGIAVFFITGRQNAQHDATIKNLTDVGYSGWTDFDLPPEK